MTDPVVVYGASSYVGGHAIRALLANGHRVVAVARRPEMAAILLNEESEDFKIGTAEDAPRLIGSGGCSVVNFAYVKNADPSQMYRQNRILMSSIEGVATGRCRRLIHISTSGVFGTRLPEHAPPVRVAKPPPDAYGESKLHAEHLVERLAGKQSCEAAIVRLGNVIGPGSPTWVAGIAQRLLEVKPVAYAGASGFSNTTHVENIGDYVAHLVGRSEGALTAHGTYHHLAEFSSRRWPEFLDVMSAEVGFPWTSVSRPGPAWSGGNPVTRALKAANRTGAGRYLRAGLGLIPDPRAIARLNRWVRSPAPPWVGPVDAVGGDDAGLLEALSAEHEFRSQTVDGWTPRLDFEAARAGIADWLRESGFSIRAPN